MQGHEETLREPDFLTRRREQEQLDRFFELSLDMFCIASSDGYFKRVNPAFEQTLGWTIEELTTVPFIDFVHADDHGPTQREVEKQVLEGQKVLRFENRYRHKDGTYRVLSWRSMPAPGGIMYAAARDVTGERDMETLLEELRGLRGSLDKVLNAASSFSTASGDPGMMETAEELLESGRQALVLLERAA